MPCKPSGLQPGGALRYPAGFLYDYRLSQANTFKNMTKNIDTTSITCSQGLIKIPNIVRSAIDMQPGIQTNHNTQILNS